MTAFVAAVFLWLALVESVAGSDSGDISWDYDGIVLGPDRWFTQFPMCDDFEQSPINILSSDVIYKNIPYFDLSEYQTSSSTFTTSLENDEGHTVKLKYSFTSQPITIRGGGIPFEYELDQLHFHWATTDKGSEHRINNKQYAMEMHIVHRIMTDPMTAVNPRIGWNVLSFLFEVSFEDNPNYDELLSYFEDVTYKNTDVSITPAIQLSNLLPSNLTDLTFHQYLGSLTTPPCNETVIWNVFTTTIPISEEQLQIFRSLRSVDEEASLENPIADNFRPVQNLNNRNIYSNDPSYSFSD